MEPNTSETTTTTIATLNHSVSSANLTSNVEANFKERLEGPNCLLCNGALKGCSVYSHYINCSSNFLKELQNSFVPSSILSYCIDRELLEKIYHSPEQLGQLQAVISHLQAIQANITQGQNKPVEQPSTPTQTNQKKKK
ncbi:hypothetical protein DLAC_06793 [Tieghemostelium lacteum]|uniref:Uncharacterized protein n=1 Tax=Tieghemostelium lacteum TaxID=361077 RepID=A0A151ZDD9_TIELA|nr:hypothetical protein DLAC_06793 [Tieghemostelium lacteum]|eukprot:KYQ91973.1 hypothetical protein DLAC_06793 [Tieghemostelium lacteum]